MTRLTAKQESFIALMTKSDEHARRGFDLLLTRTGFEQFFDALATAGLFDPSHNSAPVPAGEPGFVRIPYWDALNYLEAVAKVSGERNDLQLAEKVMTVARAVSRAREPDGTIRDNYHTHRKFAEILGLVPTAAVAEADIDLIPGWLQGRFDRGMVCHALDKGAMRRFLASESPDDWNKACSILHHCTAIRWIDERGLGEDHKKPVTVVDDHWLKTLIKNHAQELGKRVGQKAAEILAERLRETYDRARRDLPSCLHRPAVEDHEQNHEWLGPENRFVEGLRDVLLNWIDHEPSPARPFVEAMLRDETEIARRIGIHVLNQRWDILRSAYGSVIGPQFFDAGHLHELYGLLRDHFGTFSEDEKAATIEAIRQLPQPSNDEDRDRWLRRVQRKWLSSVAGKGYEPADTWFNVLNSDQSLGRLSEHSDFHSYMESWRGHGPSSYQPQELVVFAENGSLIERLNDFQEQDSWRGPTTQALVDTLEEAVVLAPPAFLRLLQNFLNAKRPFQYGVISGFKRLWNATGETPNLVDWDKAWTELIWFFEQLLGTPEFWTEPAVEAQTLTPNRDWIPPVIAQFLRAGTLDDTKAYAPGLLPRTWALLAILLERLEWRDEATSSDAMTQAINSSRGKTIEAVFSQALRACRLSDRERQEHAGVWAAMKPLFEAELAKCQNANYEFSTLAGAYITHLDYIDRDWLKAQILKIFPSEFQNNFTCALGGLAYAQVTRPVYGLLVESGVVDRALRLQVNDRRVAERLVERIALAYLWDDEKLDSPRFAYIFESGQIEAIDDAIGWFWSIRKEQLSNEQVERILKFWERCISWSRTAGVPPARLLSSLSRLSCYLHSVTDREQNMLLSVAPYVKVGYNDDFFLEELDRLVDANAAEVSIVMKAFLDSHVPDNDFEDKLKSLLTKLAEHGKRDEAIAFADRLRNLPGMIQLYTNLTSRS